MARLAAGRLHARGLPKQLQRTSQRRRQYSCSSSLRPLRLSSFNWHHRHHHHHHHHSSSSSSSSRSSSNFQWRVLETPNHRCIRTSQALSQCSTEQQKQQQQQHWPQQGQLEQHLAVEGMPSSVPRQPCPACMMPHRWGGGARGLHRGIVALGESREARRGGEHGHS